MRFDPRENIFNAILRLRSDPYHMYKWSELFKLSYLLSDRHLTKGLHRRLVRIEKAVGMQLYQIESRFAFSDSLDNFFLVSGRRITELEIYQWLNEVDTWLIGQLNRIQKGIRFSKLPPPMF